MSGGFTEFGGAAFGALDTEAIVISAVGSLQSQSATLHGTSKIYDRVRSGAFQALGADLSGSVDSGFQASTGVLMASAAIMSGYVRRNMLASFNWSGDANLEFIGTQSVIDLVEDGETEIAYAALIDLRSL